MNEEAICYLKDQGSCWRCIKLFMGESSLHSFVDADLLNDAEDNESTCKKNKYSSCCACLGILQSCSSKDIIEQLSRTIIDGGYDAPDFSLSLSLPVCLGLRIHSIWAHLMQKFPHLKKPTVKTDHLCVLKDIWRNLIGPQISRNVSKDFVSGKVMKFNVSVQIVYSDDDKECLLLEKINYAKFILRRKHYKRFNEGVFTRQVVEETLQEVNDQEFLRINPEFPVEPQSSVEFRSSCMHSSIFIAGRYNKYSRQLPQTPWLVEGDRRLESSVQETISEKLELFIQSQSVKFSASGREDVDVRCLGSGRPFVMEFINPKITIFDAQLLLRLQNQVNESTDLTAIRDLQVIERKDLNNLKEGEEEKTKSYCALCLSREPLEEEVLMSLNSMKDLVLEQMTPIRVLHRRPLSTRLRTIHCMSVERLDERIFKLFMRTQAGTYIKEFVHGDFGRTVPNLWSLLKTEIDILALDVENVQLDWPPQINGR